MCECVQYLHIVEDTPSTVRVSGAQTLPTSGVLLAALHWNSHHLQGGEGEGRVREGGGLEGGRKGEEKEEGEEEIISILVVINLVKLALCSAGWRWAFDSLSDWFNSADSDCVCECVSVFSWLCVLKSKKRKGGL